MVATAVAGVKGGLPLQISSAAQSTQSARQGWWLPVLLLVVSPRPHKTGLSMTVGVLCVKAVG